MDNSLDFFEEFNGFDLLEYPYYLFLFSSIFKEPSYSNSMPYLLK